MAGRQASCREDVGLSPATSANPLSLVHPLSWGNSNETAGDQTGGRWG